MHALDDGVGTYIEVYGSLLRMMKNEIITTGCGFFVTAKKREGLLN